jgi:hypothetical protein
MINLLILSVIITTVGIGLLSKKKGLGKIKNTIDIVITATAPVKKIYKINMITNKDIKMKPTQKIRYHVA